jgi:hypothetical protein
MPPHKAHAARASARTSARQHHVSGETVRSRCVALAIPDTSDDPCCVRQPQDPETKRILRAFAVFAWVLAVPIGLAVYFASTGQEDAVRWTGLVITIVMIAFFALAVRKGWFRADR